MAKIVGKIVLTGGPCAGKTTALVKIEQDLEEKGFYPLIISESATELIKGRIKPFGNQAIKMLDFQRLILKYQLDKEAIYEQAAKLLPEDLKCVLIYDRGIMDNKAYITAQEFDKITKELQLEQLELLDRYDLVIHLVTAADGKEEYYTLENNNSRTETKEEAIILDRKTSKAWNGHNNLVIINNNVSFDEKIAKVLSTIHNFLNTPVSLKRQQTYIVDIDLEKYIISKVNPILIEQYYIKDEDSEKRLRKRTLNNQTTYFYTVQRRYNNGLSKIFVDKKISAKDFFDIKESCSIDRQIKKIRYCFDENKQYYKLDIYPDLNLTILQVDATIENPNITIPSYIKVIKNVTNDNEYQGYSLAKSNLKRTLNN